MGQFLTLSHTSALTQTNTRTACVSSFVKTAARKQKRVSPLTCTCICTCTCTALAHSLNNIRTRRPQQIILKTTKTVCHDKAAQSSTLCCSVAFPLTDSRFAADNSWPQCCGQHGCRNEQQERNNNNFDFVRLFPGCRRDRLLQ